MDWGKFTSDILKVYPEYDGVYGPYTRGDGRQHVVLCNSKKSKKEKDKLKTISFPKALVESWRGEKLKPNETIDHIDGNFLNNDPSNLQVLDRREHYRKDAIRLQS